MEDKRGESTESTDSSESSYIFPQHVTIFHNQVAGHDFIKEKSTIGIMKHEDGSILKSIPHSGPAEITFYKNLEDTTDPILNELKDYIPKYLGTKIIQVNNEDVTCLCLEDITAGLELPCIIDIKLGVQTWEPGTPEDKIMRKKNRFAAMKEYWGFSIPGFQYYNITDGSLIRQGKSYTKMMDPQEAVRVLFSFLNGEAGIKCRMVASILEQLRKIHSWFQRQRQLLFFSSSILIVYDAKNIMSKEKGESSKDDKNVSCDIHDSKIAVRLIDFGHVIANTEKQPDENVLTSLEKLINVFENLTDLYANMLQS